MKSDAIKRFIHPEEVELLNEGELGVWCLFNDAEKLVDSLTEQRDAHKETLDATVDESLLVGDCQDAERRLLAYDIQVVLKTTTTRSPSSIRLQKFADRPE